MAMTNRRRQERLLNSIRDLASYLKLEEAGVADSGEITIRYDRNAKRYVAEIRVQLMEDVAPADEEPSWEVSRLHFEASARDVDAAVYQLSEKLYPSD